MVGLTHRYLKILTRLLYALVLISVIAGPSTVIAALPQCEPDCSMHQVETMQPPCCEIAGQIDHTLSSSHEPPGEQKITPSVCCDGKLCYDSPIGFQDTALISNSSADTMVSALKPPLLTSITCPLSVKHHGVSSIPHATTPIYIRMCVFLI